MFDNVCYTLTFNIQDFIIWSVVNFTETTAIWTILLCQTVLKCLKWDSLRVAVVPAIGWALEYLLSWNPSLPQVRLHVFQAVGSLIYWRYFAEWISCMYHFLRCLFGALITTAFVAPFYHMIKTSLFCKQFYDMHEINIEVLCWIVMRWKKKENQNLAAAIYLNEKGW